MFPCHTSISAMQELNGPRIGDPCITKFFWNREPR